MMAQWRKPRWIVMALLAMLSLVAPSFAWACPVTGIVGTPAQVCPSTADSSARTPAPMPCCAGQQAANCLSLCCKSVPQLPSQDSSKSLQVEQSHTAGVAVLSHLTRVANMAVVLFEMPPAPLQVEPPHGHSSFEDAPPIPLTAQHAPEAHAGRAPPFV